MASALTRAIGRMSLNTGHRVSSNVQLSFSSAVRGNVLPVVRPISTTPVILTEVKALQNGEKRQRQAEKRRIRNKARRSAITTRMKKVMSSLEGFKGNPPQNEEELAPVVQLISEAYKEIDKAVSKGIMHKNTAGRRKSRLARAKTRVLVDAGLYTPPKKEMPEPPKMPEA